MVLQKQDSGVCLSAMEPSSPTEVAGVARPVAFFVDVGGPATGAGATGTAVRKTPTTSSGSKTTPPRDAGLRRTSSTSSQPSPRSTWSPRTASVPSGRPPGDASASTPKTVGQRFRGTFHLSTKVPSYQRRLILTQAWKQTSGDPSGQTWNYRGIMSLTSRQPCYIWCRQLHWLEL